MDGMAEPGWSYFPRDDTVFESNIECINTNIACFLQEPGKGEPPAVLAPATGDQDFWLVRDLKEGLLT